MFTWRFKILWANFFWSPVINVQTQVFLFRIWLSDENLWKQMLLRKPNLQYLTLSFNISQTNKARKLESFQYIYGKYGIFCIEARGTYHIGQNYKNTMNDLIYYWYGTIIMSTNWLVLSMTSLSLNYSQHSSWHRLIQLFQVFWGDTSLDSVGNILEITSKSLPILLLL